VCYGRAQFCARLAALFIDYKDNIFFLHTLVQSQAPNGAWLRQQGKKFRKIGKIMYISSERARTLVSFIDFKIKHQKQRRISNELKGLVNKYSNTNF